MWIFILLLGSVQWSRAISVDEHHCVWYKECEKEEFNIKSVRNCWSSDPARPLNNETAALQLRERCPHFFENTENPSTCCDAAQIETMTANMDMADGIFGRCPICLRNLFRSICDFTCASDQSRFMKATETRVNEAGLKIVDSIEIFFSEDYAKSTYDSCKAVVSPSTGQLSMDLACPKPCNPRKWFKWLGDSDNNPYVPFLIKYSYDSKDLESPLSPPTKHCNEPYDNSSTMACSCVDCPISCKSMDIPGENEKFLIFGWSGYGLIAGSIILLIGIVFTLVIGWINWKERDNELVTPSDSSGSLYDKPVKKPLGERFRTFLESQFCHLGIFIAQHPMLTLFIMTDLVIVLSFGVLGLKITSNPIEIWSAPDSRSRIEKSYFDEHFGAFYRTEQIFIKPVGLEKFYHNISSETLEVGPVFHKEFLLAVLDLQEQVMKIGLEDAEGLERICYAPVKNEFSGPTTLDYCTVQSVWGYFQNSREEFEETSDYLDTLYTCLGNPYDVNCLAPYKGPIIPAIAVGGFLKDNQTGNYEGKDFLKSNGLVLTFLVEAPRDDETLELARRWERRFIDFMKDWDQNKRPKIMDVAYSSERSIEDELESTSKTEARTVVASYALMFLYITVALGEFKTALSPCFMFSKVSLSIGGIIIVLSSVSSAVGIFGYLGTPTSLLVLEVIPFLILAVGVDNIFILVREFQRTTRIEEESVSTHIGRVVGSVGPSLLLSTASEAFCFSIGILSEMPAVKTFAMFATVAILINFLLQMTAFISVLALDAVRLKCNRLDLCCCVVVEPTHTCSERHGLVSWVFDEVYGPVLTKKPVSIAIVVVFVATLTTSAFLIPSIEIGLDQQLALPFDSHVYKYFKYMQDLLSMGPPVYFVVTQGLNYSDFTVQNAISGASGSNDDSLYMQIFVAANRSRETYIAQPASSWLDDYYDWSLLSNCCKFFPNNGSFCPHDYDDCKKCNIERDKKYQLRPNSTSFRKYLSYFLKDVPDAACAKAGRAAYLNSLTYINGTNGFKDVGDAYFMTYHTPMKKPSDWYEALRSARLIADNISRTINGYKLADNKIQVFPYSIFYVFYEQYLTIEYNTFEMLSLSLIIIFVVTFLLTGFSLFSALIVLLTVTMILVNLMGLMVLWNISLNGVSLVNLVMAVGISVEFCSHIVHAYLISNQIYRESKIMEALTRVGSSVFSGITLTKFVGIAVLAFAKTQIFTIFYFKMYLGIVLLGVAHGLVFLPAMLNLIGQYSCTIRA